MFKKYFKIGFGFYIGKQFAEGIFNLIHELSTGVIRKMASDGSEFSIKFCEDHGIKYNACKNEAENKIGF